MAHMGAGVRFEEVFISDVVVSIERPLLGPALLRGVLLETGLANAHCLVYRTIDRQMWRLNYLGQ